MFNAAILRRVGVMLLACVTLCGWTRGAPSIWFTHDIASYGWDGTVGRPGLYASDTDTLWVSWEGYQPVNGTPQRVIEVTTYHNGAWTTNTIAGTHTLANPGDIHGIPSQVRDYVGLRNYIAYGTHNTDADLRITYSDPNNPLIWHDTVSLALASYGGAVTFPRLYIIGRTLYVMYATFGTAVGGQQPTGESGWAVTSLAINSDGSLTPSGTYTLLVNGTTNANGGWILPGSSYVSGTKIITAFSWGLAIGMVPVQNIYWTAYDTSTGAVSNYSGSTSIASGSLPVTKAQLDSNFQIYTSNNLTCCKPDLVVDAAGNTHVIDIDSTSGVPVLFEINAAPGGSFSAAHTIYTYTVSQAAPAAPEITNADNGGVAVYFMDYASPNTSYASGAGNLWSAIRSSSGSWTANSLVLGYTQFAFMNPEKIDGGPAWARVMFTEVSSDGSTVVPGTCRGAVYSDTTGFLRRGGAF